jgi:hypothetical protein
MWLETHKCLETTLGIFLYSYLYLKLAKMLCLFYYLLCFLFNEIGQLEGRTDSIWKRGKGLGVLRWEERGGGSNTVYACKQM